MMVGSLIPIFNSEGEIHDAWNKFQENVLHIKFTAEIILIKINDDDVDK